MVERHNLATRDAVDETSSERDTDQIRQDIAARRESITETVDKISERVQRTLDWREYIGEYPLASLGIAAGVGFLVAGIFKPRPSPGDRILEALSETVEDITGRVRAQLDSSPLQSAGSTQSVKAVAAALATKAVVSYLSNQWTASTNRNSTRFSTHSPREETTVQSPSGFE